MYQNNIFLTSAYQNHKKKTPKKHQIIAVGLK